MLPQIAEFNVIGQRVSPHEDSESRISCLIRNEIQRDLYLACFNRRENETRR